MADLRREIDENEMTLSIEDLGSDVDARKEIINKIRDQVLKEEHKDETIEVESVPSKSKPKTKKRGRPKSKTKSKKESKPKKIENPEELSRAEKNRIAMAKKHQAQKLSTRNIGEIPDIVDLERREKCKDDLKLFAETYFGDFLLPFSPTHISVINKIEAVVKHGGKYCLALPRGAGKALDLHTPIPTPSGWTTMGEIKAGDELFDENGEICRVTQKHEVLNGRDCYKVIFSDNEEIVCDGDHLWTVRDRYAAKCKTDIRTKPTKELYKTYRIGSRKDRIESRYKIIMQKPLQLPDIDLKLKPYTLGVWLGDGHSRDGRLSLCEYDADEIKKYMEEEGSNIKYKGAVRRGTQRATINTKCDGTKPYTVELRENNLLKNKHIPKIYLRSSYRQRLALLQGIMDTDGSISDGTIELTLLKNGLGEDVGELMSSLGVKFTCSEKMVNLNGKKYGPYLRYNIANNKNIPLFRLERKKKLKDINSKKTKGQAESRFIVNIEKVESRPVQCISVDSKSHLYLCGNKMVPTHNSTLCIIACCWIILYGHKRLIELISANETSAGLRSDAVRQLMTSKMIVEDFPAVMYPVECIEGISQRANAQLYTKYDGTLERTHLSWSSNEISLPNVEYERYKGKLIKNRARNSVFFSAGLTSSKIRGYSITTATGETLRPSLALLDDLLDEESAVSAIQNAKIKRIIDRAILGSSGHDEQMSCLMTATVIAKHDLVEQLLNPESGWLGTREKLIRKMPTNLESFWEGEYLETLKNYDATDSDSYLNALRAANDLYLANREIADEGCEVFWDDCYVKQTEHSAIQHAMNLYLNTPPDAFASEYQNEPLISSSSENEITIDLLNDLIVRGQLRFEIPVHVEKLVTFIDVQHECFFYMTLGVSSGFTSYIVDYNIFPEQSLNQRLENLGRKMSEIYKGGQEAVWTAGFNDLIEMLANKTFKRTDGYDIKIDRIGVDANDGVFRQLGFDLCKNSEYSHLLIPMTGKKFGATAKPIDQYVKRPGEIIGDHWRIARTRTGSTTGSRYLMSDINWYKSFARNRLTTPLGDSGSVSIFGRDQHGNKYDHITLFDHLTSEYSKTVSSGSMSVDEWMLKPSRENHLWDCYVSCYILASEQGITLNSKTKANKKQKREMSEAEKIKRMSKFGRPL